MPAATDRSEWELPKLRASFVFQDDWTDPDSEDQAAQEFFDVKFYPYGPPGAPPIFAAVSKKHALICRLNQPQPTDKDTNPCEIVQIIRDDDPEASNCACCWSKAPDTGRPWLCVAGNDAKVKVYDVTKGKLWTTLVGHGAGINDLVTSPDNPHIIASASEDTTVRIWSLAPAHVKQPCVCLLGGEGHAWDLLSVAFHDTGRYVLSAGHDQTINLWTLPDFPTEHSDRPVVIHYPHFSTKEVHNNLVDCVAFFGDLILSRACHEETIVLWRIEGFSSEDPPPAPSQAPTTYDPSKLTRSAFAPTLSPARPAPFTRLLQFHTPGCGAQFFMRFRMFHAPDKHPILAFCNAKSRTMFWDLARLPVWAQYMSDLQDAQASRDPQAAAAAIEQPGWIPVKKQKSAAANNRLNSVAAAIAAADKESMVSASPDPDGGMGTATPAPTTAPTAATTHPAVSLGGISQKQFNDWNEMYDMTNSHGFLKSQKHYTVEDKAHSQFVGRQVGWSPEGDWCVVVGNSNRAMIFQRWVKDHTTKEKATAPPATSGS